MHRRRNQNDPILLLLLLLLLTFETNAFGRPRSHKQQHNKRNSVETKNDCTHPRASIKNSSSADEAADPTTTDLDPYYINCGIVGFGVVQKIPYQSTPQSGYSLLDVNLSSACMRCGICIAIVERINRTLVDAHDVMRTNQWFDEAETHLFLRAICDHEFRHYTLREIDGERYIGDSNSVPGAMPVASSADGHWETTLKNKCHDILDDVGTQQLYKHWRDWCNGDKVAKPLVEILCRSADSGRLRDCQNMDGDAKKFSAAAAANDDLCYQTFDWRARVKVTAGVSSR